MNCVRSFPPNLPSSRTWPKVVYGRLFAPDVLDEERLLYLDADISLESSLEALFALDLHGYTIGAVPDFGHALERPKDLDQHASSYFNAGVMLIDRRLWSTVDLRTRVEHYFADPASLKKMQDQDFLNDLFQGDWLPIGPRWNCQGPLLEHGFETLVAPHIVHFTGGWRPWDADARSPSMQRHAAALLELCRLAKLDPRSVLALSKAKPARWHHRILARVRRGTARLGITHSRLMRRASTWSDRQARLQNMLARARRAREFMDGFDWDESAPLPTPHFDGRRFSAF
jgi:lipopolysaccharide biosynthesis glycosyltransferase